MAIFNSFLYVYQRVSSVLQCCVFFKPQVNYGSFKSGLERIPPSHGLQYVSILKCPTWMITGVQDGAQLEVGL